MTSAYEQFAATHDMNNPGAIAQWNASQGNPAPTPAPAQPSTLQQLSIGLAKGTITDQAGVNKLYGNEAYGSSVPGATPQTTQRTASPQPAPAPDPLTTLTPEQRAEFSKQFSIGLANGSLKDQAGIDAFKQTFAQSAKGGVAPSIYTTQPGANTNNAGQSATRQGDVSGAGSTASGGMYSRYGNGMTQAEKDAQDYLDTFTAPKTAEEIAAEKIAGSQDLVNNLNQNYNNQLLDQSRVNDLRTTETNARDVLNGLSGSSEAGAHATQTAQINAQDNKKIQDARALDLSNLYTKIKNDAATEARQQMLDARSNAKDILDRRDVNMTKAQDSAKNLAASGATFDGLKTTDPQTFKYLADSVGGEAQLQAIFTLNRPQEDILDKQIKDGKYIIAYRNPLTGAVRMESVDLGLPTGYSKTIDAGDRILAVPDNWDGDPKNLITINKGLTPKEVQDATLAREKAAGTSGALGAFSKDIQDAATSIYDGKSKLNEYPSAKRLQINSALNELYKAEGGDQLAQGAYDAAIQLQNDPGFAHAIGTNALAGFGKNIPGSDSASYLAKLDQLKANIKLVNVKYLKGAGALSDAEGKTLEDAGTSLSPNLSESAFKAELARVIAALEKANNVSVTPATGGGTAKQVVYNGQTYNVDANGDMTPA